MLKLLHLHERSLATLLAIMAMLMLAGCSSTDEAAQEDASGGTDCSDQPTTQREMECEAGKEMID